MYGYERIRVAREMKFKPFGQTYRNAFFVLKMKEDGMRQGYSSTLKKLTGKAF